MDEVGRDGCVLYGGAKRLSDALAEALPDEVQATSVPELHFGMSATELVDVLTSAVATERDVVSAEVLAGIDRQVGSGGRGCLGWNEAMRALNAAAVQDLVLSDQMIRSNPDDAHQLVGAALGQHSNVLRLGGEAGQRMADEMDGVAAMRRYPAGAQGG